MIELIAEVKTQSPFGFKSDKTWNELFDIANELADMIAIHTDPRWGGSFDLLRTACKSTYTPVLAKGIHPSNDDICRALEAGATYVLVVGRIPEYHADRSMIEPIGLDSLILLDKVQQGLGKPGCAQKVVWNSRDLTTGQRRQGASFDVARRLYSGWLCQASFIGKIEDVAKGADAILVGEHLPEVAFNWAQYMSAHCGTL